MGLLGPKFAVALPTSSEMSSAFLANSVANPDILKQLQVKLGWRSEWVQLDKLNIEAKKKAEGAAARGLQSANRSPLGERWSKKRLLSY
jgi:hypothetical protein